MKDRIIEMLGRGDNVKLEFADKHGFLNQDQEYEHEREAIANSSLVVTKIVDDGMAICLEDTHYYIPEDDYKYFKIKEPTFNDLIDVVVQAVKDGVALIDSLRDFNIIFKDSDGDNVHVVHKSDDERYIKICLDWIDSLYTETFVIESEDDIERVKVGALIELSNGNSDRAMLTDKYSGQSMVQFSENKHWGAVGLFILKGATVTQKRGN